MKLRLASWRGGAGLLSLPSAGLPRKKELGDGVRSRDDATEEPLLVGLTGRGGGRLGGLDGGRALSALGVRDAGRDLSPRMRAAKLRFSSSTFLSCDCKRSAFCLSARSSAASFSRVRFCASSRCWSSFLRLFTSALVRVSSLRSRSTSSSRAWFWCPWLVTRSRNSALSCSASFCIACMPSLSCLFCFCSASSCSLSGSTR